MTVKINKVTKKRFLLPFAELAPNRFKDFTKNMEIATILYLSESKRKKGENQLLKKTEEKLVFIAEAYYPIWLVPHKTATLMFDGLGLASHSFSYEVMPDVEIFSKDIQRNQKTTEAYTATLSRSIDYFRKFQDKEEIRIKGLITNPDLKEDFRNYLPLLKEINKSLTNKVVLKPTIKVAEIQDGIKQLTTLRNKIDKDIENMNAAMKLLNAATSRRVKTLRDDIKNSREIYHRKIRKTKHKSTRKLQQIQSRYNRKIAMTSKKFKQRLLRLNKNQVKLEKAYRNLGKEARRCKTKLQSSRQRHRKRMEHQWTLKLERIKKKLPTLRKEIEVNRKRIREAESAQKLELAKQRIACCRRIESANKIYRDLQGYRDAEIIMKRQEIATLEEVTRCITKSMQEMIQNKKLFYVNFDTITVPLRKQACRLVYMPFYLARYENVDKKRYAIYPPSVVGDIGVLTKMKGALGALKVKTLVQPRSKAITTFLNQLLVLFEKKPMLEKDVTEAGIQRSILLRKQLRADLTKGLKELENENWISKNELQAFNKILYMYASSMKQQKGITLIPDGNYIMSLTA